MEERRKLIKVKGAKGERGDEDEYVGTFTSLLLCLVCLLASNYKRTKEPLVIKGLSAQSFKRSKGQKRRKKERRREKEEAFLSK